MSPSSRAAHSTGPTTAAGKQRTSLNAVKHGLTGNRLILQAHEAEAYARLTEALTSELAPATESERQLVQKIIDCHTRLNRIPALETNLLNFALVENTLPTGHSDELECMAAQARAWTAHDTSFEKLGRYEARLSRQLLAYAKELDRLQLARKEAAQIARVAAAEMESEERYFRNRGKLRQKAQPEATGPLSPELASFCKSSPALKAAFELYDPRIFDEAQAPECLPHQPNCL